MNAKAKGSAKERATKALLEAEGWHVTKAGGSLGAADLIALRAGERPRMVQVKSGVGGPWAHFGPHDRAELLGIAKKAGAVAELCHWRHRARSPDWYEDWQWP